jgi:hypothetical protein
VTNEPKHNLRFVPFSDYNVKFFDVYLGNRIIGEIKYDPDDEVCLFKSCCETCLNEYDLFTITCRVKDLTDLCKRKRFYKRIY